MAILASGPSPSARANGRLSHTNPQPTTKTQHNTKAAQPVRTTNPPIDNIHPLSGCRLSVSEQPDGTRLGQLFSPEGRWLADARPDAAGTVSGWLGRNPESASAGGSGRWWALAFGAGGRSESVEVRFASLRARRIVPVVSDHAGLWVAEVAGSFRAATILAPSSTSTFRLHYAG